LSLGAWLTFVRGWGAPGMWVGIIAGLSVAALLLGGRFWRISKPGHIPAPDL
jgi:MATE family multidrug resistance protein